MQNKHLGIPRTSFPESGLPAHSLWGILRARLHEAPPWHNTRNGFRLGFPQTKPHRIAQQVFANFLPVNANHAGRIEENPLKLRGTRRLEYEVIRMLANLFGDDRAEGYITTGGTESNLEAIWMGRACLGDYRGSLALLKTKLTHHSIDKAASIMSIPTFDVSLDTTYGMSAAGLSRRFLRLYSKGFRKFLIVATAGYTATGTLDPIAEIAEELEKFESKRAAATFLHVDAALGGFTIPFSDTPASFDFRVKKVETLAADMHKMGLAPYPAGVFLARRGLNKKLGRYIEYAGSEDWMVSGSRSGASAAACWAILNTLGRSGYTAVVKGSLAEKEWLIAELRELFPKLGVITHSAVNAFAACFPLSPRGRLPGWLEQKYRLHPITLPHKSGSHGLVWYKLYIMPHATRSILRRVLEDFRAAASGRS